MEWARIKRQELLEAWAQGEFSAAWSTEMIVKNAGATGACSILQDFLEISYLDLESEDE